MTTNRKQKTYIFLWPRVKTDWSWNWLVILSLAFVLETDCSLPLAYSLFDHILGVAFFQFAQWLFKIFKQNFSRIIFSSSPNIPENLVGTML